MPRKMAGLEPIYSARNVRLFHGDTHETLALMNSKRGEWADMIFADPPYGLSNDGFTVHAGERVSVNKGTWDRSRGLKEDLEFHYEWIKACRRALKPNGTLWISGTYHSIHLCGYALQEQGWHLLNDIAWYKPNASPNLSCRMFAASHETLLWARKTKRAKHHFDYEAMKNGVWHEKDLIKKPGKQMRSVWSINTPARSEKIHGKHPTQKPVALMNRIVLASSQPGDLVFDPFCGSATTGVAAITHGRGFVGIDSKKSYLEKLAIPRLSDAQKSRPAMLDQEA